MRRPRRNHSAKFKSRVALAALKGEKTLVELSEQFDVHANQITDWKIQLLKSAEEVFLTKAERRELESGPSVKDLQAKIGQLTMENDFLAGALSLKATRSVEATMRAPSDDRSGGSFAGYSPGTGVESLEIERVLPTGRSLTVGSCLDETHRRTTPGTSVSCSAGANVCTVAGCSKSCCVQTVFRWDARMYAH